MVAAAGKGVHLLGSRDNNEVREMLPTYSGLIFPSRCFEGLPTIYLESLAAQTPVAALVGNSAADHVRIHETGVEVEDDRSWARALEQLLRSRERLAANCARSFAEGLTQDAWLGSIQAVYDDVMRDRAASS